MDFRGLVGKEFHAPDNLRNFLKLGPMNMKFFIERLSIKLMMKSQILQVLFQVRLRLLFRLNGILIVCHLAGYGVVGPVRAAVDLSLLGSARSYPQGGFFEANLGLHQIVWGRDSEIFKSHARVQVHGGSIGTFHTAGALVEYFPVSFLGARAGYEANQSQSEYKDLPCDGRTCKGRWDRRYLDTYLGLAWRNFWSVTKLGWQHYLTAESLPLIEPTWGVALSHDFERAFLWRQNLGFSLNANWSVAISHQRAGFKLSAQQSQSSYLLGVLALQGWKIGLAGGRFESSQAGVGPSFFGFVEWSPWPAPARF